MHAVAECVDGAPEWSQVVLDPGFDLTQSMTRDQSTRDASLVRHDRQQESGARQPRDRFTSPGKPPEVRGGADVLVLGGPDVQRSVAVEEDGAPCYTTQG